MARIIRLTFAFGVAAMLCGMLLPVAEAHLCDNVFRQPEKLIVKPEITNIIVKESIAFKVYLQNNMDRGISQIRLGGRSPAFIVVVSPEQMVLPKGARAFFNVELKTRPNTPSGSYPLEFRLFAVKGQVEQDFKSFSLAGSPAHLVPRLSEEKQADAAEPGGPIKVDGKATEPSWRKALVMSSFRSTDGKPANPQTVVLAAFDSKAFYFALTCIEPKPQESAAGDSIVLKLRPDGRKDLYTVAVKGDGTLALSVRKDKEERRLPAERAEVKVSRRDREWFVEMALPWAVFGMDGPPESGERWRLNIVRRRAVDGVQTSFWAGSPENYEEPESYGQLFFAPES